MYNKIHIDRLEEMEAIKGIIENRDYYKENSEKGISILINGMWGSGKTTFVNDLCKNPEFSNNYKIIKYDAFKYDFYDNPFIPLFSFLKDELKLSLDINKLTQITSNQIFKLFQNLIYSAAKSFLKTVLGMNLEDIKKQMEEIKENYDETNSVYEEFKELEKIKNDIKKVIRESTEKKSKDDTTNKPIIFIIDELDRCKPTFAIGTLEIMKHFLDIENLIIVLSVDEKQLQESVKTIYGQGMNSDIYFSKFFDYKLNLRRISFADILDKSSVTDLPEISEHSEHIFKVLNISIRDSHKIFTEFLGKYEKFNKYKWTEAQCIFILFMITIKNTDLVFYNSIINLNFANYKNSMERANNLEKSKYSEVLKYKVNEIHSLEDCINNLIKNQSYEYFNIKNLNNYYSTISFEDSRNMLNIMSEFIPRVAEHKSYMENLLKILG